MVMAPTLSSDSVTPPTPSCSLGAVDHGHEGAAEGVAVDRAPHLHETAGTEELHRVRHHHVGPAALAGALLQGGRELPAQTRHGGSSFLPFTPSDRRTRRESSRRRGSLQTEPESSTSSMPDRPEEALPVEAGRVVGVDAADELPGARLHDEEVAGGAGTGVPVRVWERLKGRRRPCRPTPRRRGLPGETSGASTRPSSGLDTNS